MQALRDATRRSAFEELIDLCGVDYSQYGEGTWDGLRYAVTSPPAVDRAQLARARARTFAPDDEMPIVESITPNLARRQLVRTRSVRPVSASCSTVTATCAAF